MASTFDNDLRLEEMATGENAGSWGTKTNTNLELIADAFGYGTFTIANADTTLTIPDGSGSDNALRSLYLKISSSADLTTTRVLTIDPNTVSKLWYIENNTSGGQTITISQGSGANVNILNGQAKLVATDGAGAGAAVIDLTDDLAIKDLFVDENISMQSDGAAINFGADAEIQLTHVADTGLLLTETGGGAPTLQFRDSALSISSSADGQLDIDADNAVAFDTDTLYIDTANNRVGIGDSTPSATLNVLNDADGSNSWTNAGSAIIINETDATRPASIKFGPTTASEGGQIVWGGVGGDGPFVFRNYSTERLRIDSSGRVLVGLSSSVVVGSTAASGLQLQSTGSNSWIAQVRYQNGTSGPVLNFGKTRSTTVGTVGTIVADGDYMGAINFSGDDGTDLQTVGASIVARVDGTPGANDMPTRLAFLTTADGSNSASEHMRINSSGNVIIGAANPGFQGKVDITGTTTFRAPSSGSFTPFNVRDYDSDDLFSVTVDGTTGKAQIRAHSDTSPFMTFMTGTTEAMRIDSGQRILIGDGDSVAVNGFENRLQVSHTGYATASLAVYRNGSDGAGLNFAHSRSATIGTNTILQDGDAFGHIYFNGADGTDFATRGAAIVARVDGTPGSNDMPGRIQFSTTADGASSVTERMRISSDGHMGFGETNTDDVYYQFKKSGTDYSGDFATYNMGQMDSFRFYQSASTKWAKVFARSYQTGSQFGTQAAILEIQGHGSTGGNGHHVTLHVTTKQQQSSDGYDIYATGNGGYNVAYKYDASGGHESAGLLEIWVQPQENYVTTCLWVKTSQRKGDPTSEPVGWFGLEDTGSGTQPTGSTIVQQHNPFMGLHYTDGNPSGKYETSDNYQGWYPQLNVNRYLALGAFGTSRPTIDGSDNQIMQISGTSNRASMNIFHSGNTSGGPKIRFAKGRSGTVNGIGTKPSGNDQLGIIVANVDDGTDANSYGAYINFAVDGTVGSNDTPGRIEFATTADGASAATERMRIRASGTTTLSKSGYNVGVEPTGATLNVTDGHLVHGLTDGLGGARTFVKFYQFNNASGTAPTSATLTLSGLSAECYIKITVVGVNPYSGSSPFTWIGEMTGYYTSASGAHTNISNNRYGSGGISFGTVARSNDTVTVPVTSSNTSYRFVATAEIISINNQPGPSFSYS